jgi:serine/threonine protein kinase
MSDLDDFPETTASATPKTGATIGPYKLLEQIGEGGMGSVWVASQSQPIKRRVAIKLIKAGMDSGQVLARFEAERQTLAMMDHPNIARVLDGGMTDQGRPYFAMEYVKGVPLTEYCDNAKLSLKERLELFVPVCQAVQHAHQKGIIHRDLKPSNILICLYDGKPVPKVIDFGLAKAMHQSLTDHSIYTAHGMMVGTPLYMSPEQAEQNNLDIDTRTDIYALGVILYELLTGTTPLEKAQMKQAAYDEVLRLIKEVEPPKPSMRLSGSDSLPSVAAQRSIEPAQLTRSISGDLDWVVMKALEKERSRRYETANGLAEDIRRHLADEPVSASPPSTSYRVKKFIRRNRAGVIAASVIAVTLLLGVAGTTGGMLWALAERKEAVAAREAETEAKQEAVTNAALAREEADRATAAEHKTAETLKEVEAERDAKEVALKEAEQLSEFLTNVFQSPDPTKDGREIKVVELLDSAAQKLETDLADQPLQRAKLQESLAGTYFSLGLYKSAIPLHEKVRDYLLATSGPDAPDTLAVMQHLGNAYTASHRTDEAITLLEEVLNLSRAKTTAPNTQLQSR